KTGSTITLKCDASDANQQANTLSVNAWAGECSSGNCFATRSWTYASGSAMTYSGNTFTKDITITSPAGTSVAATCQATDSLGAGSNWGDAYPLCVVNQCQNPPSITINSIAPNPSGVGKVTVTFTADRALRGDPTVKIKPGSQIGGTSEITASFVSKNGNSYVYEFNVAPSSMSGIADVGVNGNYDDSGNNCDFSQIAQMSIDTTPPTTSIRCDGGLCASTPYSKPVTITLTCSDATGCASTRYAIGSGAFQSYAGQFVIASSGAHSISYMSTDTVGNAEQAKIQIVRAYLAPCRVPAEEPECQSGRIEEEVVFKLKLDSTNILSGATFNSNFYCFLRDKQTKAFSRSCRISPNSFYVIIDRSTVKEKNYFDFSSYQSADLLTERYYTTSETLNIGSYSYPVSNKWTFPIDTRIFQSEVCAGGQDADSGLGGEDCGNFSVSNSQFLVDATFPDFGVTVPATLDGTGAPNFTKLMPINFEAVPYSKTAFTSIPCTGVNCRVEFSFVPFDQWAGNAPKTANWNEFEKAYVPQTIDVASNSFSCDSYKTLFIRATKVGGETAEVTKPFFVNCDTKLTVIPLEKRVVLGAFPGRSFNVTAWNPSNSDKIFELAATTTNPNGHPLQWTNFDCAGEFGCEAGPVPGDAWLTDDDKARLTAPSLTSRQVSVSVATAAKSGQFPITFVATENGNSYSTVGTLLIFAEGLNEFAAWQLGALVLIVIALLYYSDFFSTGRGMKKKKR
ncbi:MAG: hypothetical protein HY517_04470, partial [Candidatus Aenigmarchaeota archaeon]|nr:hypothetical protein [Candidatus Aenigmarchaeota archaeon]